MTCGIDGVGGLGLFAGVVETEVGTEMVIDGLETGGEASTGAFDADRIIGTDGVDCAC